MILQAVLSSASFYLMMFLMLAVLFAIFFPIIRYIWRLGDKK